MSLSADPDKRKHNSSIVFRKQFQTILDQTCLPEKISQKTGHQSFSSAPGWARWPCVCGGRAPGKGDEKQLENMQGSPKGC